MFYQRHYAFLKRPWYLWAMNALLASHRSTRGHRFPLPLCCPPLSLQHRCIHPKPLSGTMDLKRRKMKIQRQAHAVASEPLIQQCHGIRIDGLRCRRMVPMVPECTDGSDRYCHFHRYTAVQKSNSPIILPEEPISTNTLVPSLSTSLPLRDCWSLWIGNHIRGKKRNLIQQEMERPISDRDEDGYIYAYSLVEGPRASTTRFAYFKIGRSTNPPLRMYQVSNRCNFVPQVIEIFPRLSSTKTKEERYKLPKCPLSHRVERLIHLELTSMFSTAGFKCGECRTSHREWFRVARQYHANGKPMSDAELWETRVRPVILRWIQFGLAASIVHVNSGKARS
ncbi:uncharacterized protein BYT42DRAFT_511733 [Radiomyces spectabilis]|uniref:uncharacterized protein n=1 Tax=Radiomyces spectabilis TaxID=64574 RepID=UPI00221FF6C1|nr:uncharacterized protein BYT42DRAFT_511733 [Radiomyces spectabilis]KAI8384288.1 hypothetical protein BYT42DRAFT_511733 [Radiomyces spectabilis]